jgi:hypothetical protein
VSVPEPWTPAQDAVLQQGLSAGESYAEIAQKVGRTSDAVRNRKRLLGLDRSLPAITPPKPFDIPALPSDKPSADELLERRKRDFKRKETAKLARKLIPVNVHIDGPIGIAHFGDPHVDDDGTDLSLLQRHLDAVNRTEGMFAGNVGDYQNNWIGRLARLYGEQSMGAQESWVLVEWLIGACDWLYLVGGNHDAWSGAGDPLQWITRQQGALLEPSGARLELRLPSGRNVRLNARHDFKGHSQWNTAHGVAKAAQMGWRDHILTCGHMHTSGYQVVKDPATGLISHAIRTASYKTFDRYAEEGGLPDQNIFVCPVTIIDPRFPDSDPRFVTTLFDPEEAADYLTWKRSRKAA